MKGYCEAEQAGKVVKRVEFHDAEVEMVPGCRNLRLKLEVYIVVGLVEVEEPLAWSEMPVVPSPS